MRRVPDRAGAKRTQQFITVQDGRMSYCVNEVYGKGKDAPECNVIIVFNNEQASRVTRAIGFCPKEGETHYIGDDDVKILREVSEIISSI